MTRVGIVGGGITGLALAHHLDREGVEYRLFEADDQPGGVIRSGEVEGRVLEWGPQRLRFTEPIAELVEDLDLRGAVIEADPDLPLYVYANGELREVPFSLRELVSTDLLSWRAKLRVLAEPFTSRGREEETAAELFTRKFGREAYENLIAPLFGGIYASDPAEMPVRHSLSGVLRLERDHGSLLRAALERAGGERPPPASFEDGMQRLPEALAERHAERVELGMPVESIRTWGDEYRLETPEETVDVDQVVVTTPADVTADLLSGIAPGAEGLADLTYNPLAMVHLCSETDARGMGYQVRHDEDLHTLGVSWNASLFDRDGVYTVFLGGMHEPELPERPDDELGRIAREEFETVMDADAEVLSVRTLERGFPAYDRSWDALDELEVPGGVHLATNYTDRMGVPSRVRQATSLASRIADSLSAMEREAIEPTP